MGYQRNGLLGPGISGNHCAPRRISDPLLRASGGHEQAGPRALPSSGCPAYGAGCGPLSKPIVLAQGGSLQCEEGGDRFRFVRCDG
jgi:hypothetical protein